MTPHLFTSKLAQRLSKTVVIGAMALGLGFVAFAPAPASAAPAESQTCCRRADLIAAVLDFDTFVTGQRREVSILVRNNGDADSLKTTLKIVTGTGFISPFAGEPAGSGVACGVMRRDPDSGNGVIYCTINNVKANGLKEVGLAIQARAQGERWVRTTIDPNNKINESDETNNSFTRHY